ncbi:hypothetical protein PPL_07079 [Heterostelium album PN500]|uniref:Uncharacterized protein n=1 Tax=Heterostelium pallidum (strain ATCC 26659 / Pp 5 / PN500) TaxID=670386 RepID=D3BEC3_HETP5|nr:hypothetical protein PPL_07079 [Heterostelium album PN500]EFA80254.1 hypothetical protein PPL_07079 [Heterostelium album PN500]|eukprot:XP_020432374.1 hypothetical protein PPL_07079 [Heterostelium album PN500]
MATNSNYLSGSADAVVVSAQDAANSRTKPVSPKKILIQKYHEDLEALMIRNYSSRLFLTWIYKNSSPPVLTPIPNINITMPSPLSLPLFIHQQQQPNNFTTDTNKILSPLTTPLADIERYINRLLDTISNVIHFFYVQNCKRHTELVQQQFKNNPNHIFNKQNKTIHSNINNSNNNTDYNSIFVGCIYYADLFVRKNSKSSISILDILITSIIITIKMWIEEKMSVNKYMSKIFGISLAHINQQEINFLKSIDYQIYLHEKDIKLFTDIIHKSSVQKSSNENDQQTNNNTSSNNNIPNNITQSNNNNSLKCINNNNNDNTSSVPSQSASNTPVLSQSSGSTTTTCIIISPDIRSSSSSPSIAQPSLTSSSSSCLTTPTIRYNNNHYHHQHISSSASASASLSPISIVPSSPNTPQHISKQSALLQPSTSNKRKPLFQNITSTPNKLESYTQQPNLKVNTPTTTLVLCSTRHTPNNINNNNNNNNHNNNIIITNKSNDLLNNNNNNNNINTSNEEDEDYYNFDIIEEPRKRIKEIVSF